ncbi:MAG: RidA family protein [Chloroflexota bacterium]|nr:RidA family protein [Chloroflexota bacterium]
MLASRLLRFLPAVLPALLLAPRSGLFLAQQDPPPQPRLPFVAAVRAGNTHYLSGWGSRNPATGEHPEGFDAQVHQLMKNLQELLRKHGRELRHVVQSHAYITYPDRFADFARIYGQYFSGPPPALTLVGVPRLPATEVEIAFIASHAGELTPIRLKGVTTPAHASPALRNGDYVYVSGMDSRDLRTGRLPEGSFRDHARKALENVGTVLRAAGMTYRDAVKVEVFLTDLAAFEAMNEVYRSVFAEAPPTRTTIGVTELPGGSPIVINLVAATRKEVIVPDGVKPNSSFSPAIRVGDRVFLSGKIGTVPGGVGAQVREVMDDLGRTLRAAGLDFSQVVEAKVYLADMEDYAAMNEAYGGYFRERLPARSCIQAGSLLRNSRVEITLTADASVRP